MGNDRINLASVCRRSSLVLTAGLALLAVGLAACSSSSGSSSGSGGVRSGGSSSAGSSSSSSSGSAAGAPTSHTLTLSFLQDPGQPPDPAVYYAGQGLLLQDNIYDGLLQYAPGVAQRQIIPDLATSWTVSANSETYTLQLRQGVVFHDGTPFTSAAVAPSFARDSAVNGGPAYMAQAVQSIQTPGPYTVVINLSSPNASFLDYLAAAYGPRIYSPTGLAAHAGTDHDQTYLQAHDLGTGPYTLTKAVVGVDYQMQAFPKYWGKQPYYTTIDMPVIDNFNTEQLEFESGQIDAILHDLPSQAIDSFSKNSKYTVYTLPTLQSEFAYINPNIGFLTSAANRVALIDAINPQQIVNDVYPGRGVVAPSLYPHDLLPAGLAAEPTSPNPKALAAIVSKLPASEKSITIGYDTSSPDDGLIAEIMANQLSATGLSVQSVGFDTSTIYGWSPPSPPKGAPAILIEYVWPDAYDPYQWSHIALDPSGGINYLHCNVPNSSAELAQAVETNDTTLFGKVGDAAIQAGCIINLVNRDDYMVAQPWLKGIPAAHVSAAPNTLSLAALYPG
jgi:peptide/nickel transport system substrate-binding protein